MADLSGRGELARLHAVTLSEHEKLADVQVVGAAEELVAAARIVDVLEEQVEARRRHAAAQLRLSEAMKAGSRDTVAAGKRCAAAQTESERVCGEGTEEMAQIVEAGADRLDLAIDQYGRWADAADAEFHARLDAG
jgi:hypothetical protein